MRVLNTKDLGKVADPKDIERITAKTEPEPDPQAEALDRLAQSITSMQERQSKLFADILLALTDKGDQEQIKKQISVLERLEQTITSSMDAYSQQVAKALADVRSDKSQPEATDRLTKVVAMLAERKGEEDAEVFAKLDTLIDRLGRFSEREPVVNVDNPVTVAMPEPPKQYVVNVVRTPQGLIDHAILKREQ